MESRFDRVELKASRNDSGAIIDSPVLTRAGVFDYRNADGSVRKEYRPPSAVFAADSLAAYRALPITNGHPGKVNHTNVQSVLCGTVTSPGRQDGQNLVADIVVHVTAPVDVDGKKELSVGYDVELDETPGTTPEGERYDAVQTKIVPNHLALVKKGRAGTARLNLDAAEDAANENQPEPKKETAMPKVRLDSGIEYEASQEVIHALETARKANATLEAERDSQKARADAADGKVAKLEGDAAKMRQDAFAAAKARIELEARAKALGVEFKADSADRALREAIIGKVRNDSADLTAKSDAYIEAAFDLAVAQADAQSAAAGQQRAAANGAGAPAPAPAGVRKDSADDATKSAGSAREAMVAAMRKQG